MKKIRKMLGSFWFIHFMVFLNLLALLGYIMVSEQYFIFFIAFSFWGAICGSLIRIIDVVKKNR